MERFRDGLDGKLYERLNLLEPANFHELMNNAISQEDAMKKATRTRRGRLVLLQAAELTRSFTFVKKNVPNPSQPYST
jgi:predicted GIY-YIG superfamily endonuclease